MTRPRGRPRRGSPWKPRRPPITPPDSTSADSSPRHQSVSTPVSLQAPQFRSMAIIPKTPISLLRLIQNPEPSHTPAGNIGCGPAPQRKPNTAEPHHRDSFDRAQFRDNLAILHTLVFELRQEVADLHFRMEATEAKVANFLQILSSMHAALFPDPVEASPKGDPEVDKDEGQHNVTSPPVMSRKKERHEDDAEEAERNQEDDKQWGDGTTYIEEEPWPGDLPATWTSYQPGV
jgi:hypothetical protein